MNLSLEQGGGGRAPVVEKKKDDKFEDSARDGMFLLLENYMKDNPWTREQAARDIWQNFFDANKFTTEGLEMDYTQENGKTSVKISGSSTFPYNRLFSLGAGFKDDPTRAAGGKHEGSKVLALSLLRDYGCDKVVFGSGDWVVTFYLAEPPEGAVDSQMSKQRAMYAKLEDSEEYVEGSYISLTSSDQALGQEIVSGRDLFYRENHPDFINPDVVTSKGGFKILGKGNYGNFYLNGQRIKTTGSGKDTHWNNLDGVSFWTTETPVVSGKKLTLGRDRDGLGIFSINELAVPFVVESMSSTELVSTFNKLESWFEHTGESVFSSVPKMILVNIIAAFKRKGIKMSFPPSCLAMDVEISYSDADGRRAADDKMATLKGLGYKICMKELGDIGMNKMSTREAEIMKIEKVEPNKRERERIELLEMIVEDFINSTKKSSSAATLMGHSDLKQGGEDFKNVPFRKIQLFGMKHPYLAGKYVDGEVWISREEIHSQDLHAVLATYLHELCHSFGSDQSATFSYALTELLYRWSRFAVSRAEAIRDLEKEWTSIKIVDGWEKISDFNEDYERVVAHQIKGELNFEHPARRQIADYGARMGELMDKYYKKKFNLEILFPLFQDITKNQSVMTAQVINRNAVAKVVDGQKKLTSLQQTLSSLQDEWKALENRWENKGGKPKKMKDKDSNLAKEIVSLRLEIGDIQKMIASKGIEEREQAIINSAKAVDLPKYGMKLDALYLSDIKSYLIACAGMLLNRELVKSDLNVLERFLLQLKNLYPNEYEIAVTETLAYLKDRISTSPTPGKLKLAYTFYRTLVE